MTNRTAGLLRFRKLISITLGFSFLLYTLFVLNFRIFIDTPAFNKSHVFIGEAKTYFFEGSDTLDKDLEFGAAYYKDLWLKLPNVSEVVTKEASSPTDYLSGSNIVYVTISNQKMTMSLDDKDDLQLSLLKEALNQVSASAWNIELKNCIQSLIVWVCLTALLISWIVYLDKTTGVLL